jgi:hypothetical protein
MSGITPKQAALLAYEANRKLLDLEMPKNLIQEIIEKPALRKEVVTKMMEAVEDYGSSLISRVVADYDLFTIYLKPITVEYYFPIQEMAGRVSANPPDVTFPDPPKVKAPKSVDLVLRKLTSPGGTVDYKGIKSQIKLNESWLKPAGFYELAALKRYSLELFLAGAEHIVAPNPETLCNWQGKPRIATATVTKTRVNYFFDSLEPEVGGWTHNVFFLFFA